MACDVPLRVQIAHAEQELARCEGVYPMMVRAGVMAAATVEADLAAQGAIIASLRRLELLQNLADFGRWVPLDFLEAIRSPAHMEDVRARLQAAVTPSKAAAHG